MAQYELNIRDYWRIIKKRRTVMLLTSVSFVVGTVVYSNLQTPVYRASATVRVEVRRTAIGALTERILGGGGDILLTEENIIKSRPIIEEAARRLNLINKDSPRERIDEVVGAIEAGLQIEREEKNTNIISIAYVSNKPERARDVVNKIVEVYVEESFKRKNKEAHKVRVFIENSLAGVEQRLKKAEDALKVFKEKEVVTGVAVSMEGRLAKLQNDLQNMLSKATEKHPDVIRLKEQIQEAQEQLKKLPAAELEFARLKRDVDVNEKLYTMLRERFEESRINEAQQIADASIVNPAIEPKSPIRPNKKFAFIVGCIVGIMLSFILAFIAENLDASIGTIEDVEGVLKLPVLAVIPSVKSEEKAKTGWFKKQEHQKTKQEDDINVGLIAHLKPFSQMAESFRILRTNLKISEERKTILFTSAGPREGKSSVLMGVAVTLSQVGVNTLVVDSDLRRPAINKLIGVERDVGVNELLSGKAKIDNCLKGLADIMMGELGFDNAVKNPGLDNLHIITSGHIAVNPSEILSSKSLGPFIEEAKNRFDVVLFDSPPSLSITDAAIIAPKVDGVVLVYEMGRTARSALLRAKIQLESVGAKVLGVVLNHISPETYLDTSYYPYYYHYKYKYSHAEDKEPLGSDKVKDST